MVEKSIAKIEHRLENAIRGQRNSDWWDDAEINLSAPKGMSYNDWIDEAMIQASNEISELNRDNKRLEDIANEQARFIQGE